MHSVLDIPFKQQMPALGARLLQHARSAHACSQPTRLLDPRLLAA